MSTLLVPTETPTPDSTSKTTENIVSIAGMLYLLPLMAFLPYFNWKFANEHGFMAWLFFGEIWPSMKAILWPIFIFIG